MTKAIQLLLLLVLLCFDIAALAQEVSIAKYANTVGETTYESKDHRSNVYEVVSDRKVFKDDNFQGQIVAHTDYYPYGMSVAQADGGRTSSGGDYRYGFNSWEKDNKISGQGNYLSFGNYGYAPRIGKRWNIDPLSSKYPNLTSYHFTGNNPIRFVDFDGEDFGVKINHTNKTVVIVANVYTTSSKAYKQALKAAGVWNAKGATVDGYAITFQVKVQKPVSVTDAQAVKYDPSIVKKNGKYRKGKLSTAKSKLTNKMALGKADLDDIGNVYAGNKGKYSENISGEGFKGGVTYNGVYINMNTHKELGDIGEQEDPVTHEFGHLFGLDDEGGEHFSEDGIMKYKGFDLNPISDNDVKDILNFAKKALDSKTKPTDSKVKLLESTGDSGGSNPIGVKSKKDD